LSCFPSATWPMPTRHGGTEKRLEKKEKRREGRTRDPHGPHRERRAISVSGAPASGDARTEKRIIS